ncbi:MAG: heparinase II/III family protein [Lentisphaeria bacterium]|nr:heparinase II/III family protein [Lentisphaeria bacterium]
MNRIFVTVLSVLCLAAASECLAAGKTKSAVSAEPRRNFREMPIPNLVKVTGAEVDKIMECLPEKPGLYGGNIHDRAFWSEYPVPKSILESAEKRLAVPVPHFTVEQFNEETKKTGKRPSVRSFYTELGRFIAVMVVAECKENKGRFIPKIEEAMDAFITGANPAFGHLFLFDRDMKRQNERGWRYVELNNALNFSDVATAYYLMDDKISPELRKRVYAYFDEWVFSPMFWNLSQPDKKKLRKVNYNTSCMSWLVGGNNWNPYCWAFVLDVVFGMLESRRERAYLVASMVRSQDFYFARLTEQGYIPEGVGYWGMGIQAYLRGAQKVLLGTGGKVDILKQTQPKVRRSMYIARDMMMAPGGLYPHFADHGREGLPVPFGKGTFFTLNQAFGENIYPEPPPVYTPAGMHLGLEYFYTISRLMRKPSNDGLKPAEPQKPYFWDPEAQILIVRDRPDASLPLSFALKGGNNAEPHNHNDIGSFVVGVGSRILCGDPGIPVYISKTVGIIRSSAMHPVPMPNGVMQKAGDRFKGKVLAVENDDRHSLVRMDLSGAYPAQAGLVKLVRTAEYDRDGRRIVITDECELKNAGEYQLPLLSYETWKEESPGVWRAGDLKVEIKASGALECAEDVPQLDWRTPKKARRLTCKFTEKAKTFRMEIIFTPAAGKN